MEIEVDYYKKNYKSTNPDNTNWKNILKIQKFIIN
jgi:hypothetical protein